MKINLSLKLALGLALSLTALLNAPVVHADIVFHVTIDTAPLIGNPGGPYSLDLQLNGSGTGSSNTAIVNNFLFGTGSPTGSANTTSGVTGDLSSVVTLQDSAASPFTEFYQTFSPGNFLRFDVSLTTLPNSPTPDAFSVAILDNGLANIPTTGLGDALVLVNIDKSQLGQTDLQAFSGTGLYAGVRATAVPEMTNPLALLAVFSSAAGIFRHRRRR